MPTILEAAGFTMETWPNCATPDCGNKRCIWSLTDLCCKCAEQAMGHGAMRVLYFSATGRDLDAPEDDDDAAE